MRPTQQVACPGGHCPGGSQTSIPGLLVAPYMLIELDETIRIELPTKRSVDSPCKVLRKCFDRSFIAGLTLLSHFSTCPGPHMI